MRTLRTAGALGAALLATAGLAACGGGGGGSSSASSNTANSSISGGGQPGALSAEAQSAATGDIPDSQVFLTFNDASAGYSMKYPEGWAQRGSGPDVTFQAKNNVVHIVVAPGPAPTPASAAAGVAKLRAAQPSLTVGSPTTLTVRGAPVIKVSYTTQSQPNPVTGKRVQLLVDRYLYDHAGKVAILDLGSPKGVDNVDAYKMMSQSFQWR